MKKVTFKFNHSKSSWFSDVLVYGIVGLTIYVSVACFAYRLRYPEQTETQLMLNFFDALLWK